MAVAGRNDSSSTLYLVDSLRKLGLRVVGEKSPTLLENSRETKDRKEIERLREVGRKTCWVVNETVKFLRTVRSTGSRLIYKSKPLTVGDVKKIIGRLLVQQDLVAIEETIFASGKGGSDPHYHGLPDDPVRPREPIIFDIFPSEPDGYWHDTSRTLVYGKPPPKVKDMYRAVLEAQDMALDMVKQGARCSDLMNSVCKHFEKQGYPTARQLIKGNKEARTRGFMHGLGHGVGLTIGERPYLSLFGRDILRKGSVVTIEPGLYAPKYGGVRLEDIMVVESQSENLTSLPREMEL